MGFKMFVLTQILGIINVVISLILLTLCLKAYKEYKLRIFKRAWLVIAFSLIFWCTSYFLFLFKFSGKTIYFILLTLFMCLNSTGIWLLIKAAQTLGGV